MIKTILATAATSLALSAVGAAAWAQTANRAWVSGHGTDTAGCGAPTAPCRSLQYAHDHIVAAGGEIDVLDPAGYGAITITKAISIINDGVGTAGVQATTGVAITINAGAGAVVLKGLDIEGVGASNGVHFAAGGSLKVLDSTIKGFTADGLTYTPVAAGYLYVSDTRIIDNGSNGVEVFPQIFSGTADVKVTLAHIEADNDFDGVLVDGQNLGAGVKLNVAVLDSVVADCQFGGVTAETQTASVSVMVRGSAVVNSGSAINAFTTGSVVDIAHSTVSGNVTAFDASNGGALGSFGDNDVDFNAAVGSTPSPVALQ